MIVRKLQKIKNLFFPPDGRKLLSERLSTKLNLGYQYENIAFEAIQTVRNNTMLPYEQLVSLYEQIVYCEKNKIPGSLVECGVWKGGASGLMALANKQFGDRPRPLYLFDAFDDICEPDSRYDDEQLVKEIKKITSSDKNEFKGELKPLTGIYDKWGGHGTLNESKILLEEKIKYPGHQLFYVKGWFQDTVPVWKDQIDEIAVLRLDGDWYESTKVCMEGLYPKLVKGGICIIDDYGYNKGCSKAVHEYLDAHNEHPLMCKIDYLRYWIKP
ncbi:MAG: TylF/MycF family methyltransferase [Chitinophagaceae bacterium]|nr:TylF/MycF family methyltransferase [Chitinophagaceae bacterium]